MAETVEPAAEQAAPEAEPIEAISVVQPEQEPAEQPETDPEGQPWTDPDAQADMYPGDTDMDDPAADPAAQPDPPATADPPRGRIIARSAKSSARSSRRSAGSSTGAKRGCGTKNRRQSAF